MKAKTILAVALTALCWISLCIDWDFCMYLTGVSALVVTGLDDLKANISGMTEKIRKFSVKNSVTSDSSRKEVVKA